MLLVPELCSKVEADGVKAIWPALTEYAVGESVVPPTVTPEISPRQVASSVKVTLNALSTVALPAAVKVGGVPPGVVKVETVV